MNAGQIVSIIFMCIIGCFCLFDMIYCLISDIVAYCKKKKKMKIQKEKDFKEFVYNLTYNFVESALINNARLNGIENDVSKLSKEIKNKGGKK